MHVYSIDSLVQAMRTCLERCTSKPFRYEYTENGIIYGSGSQTISHPDELTAFRAELITRFGFEGEDDAPEGL